MTKKSFWSEKVTKESNALDLEEGIFTWKDFKKIAASLKFSADNSPRRRGTPYQSAMSMLNFYINRAGKNLSAEKRKTLEQAKIELRKLYKRQIGKEIRVVGKKMYYNKKDGF